jgi:hypothetical protein
MELGLLVDAYRGPSLALVLRYPERVQEWVRGTPRRSLLDVSFKARGRDRLQVATLRCVRCGFLEMYAPDSEGTCRHCGYDRSGLGTEDPCPECGKRMA